MGAVVTKATADLGHRRLQTAVLAVVLFLASGAGTLALNILVASQAPFERAFARSNGAHLVIDFDPSIGDAALTSTQSTEPVTASAGPWPVTTAALGPHGGFSIDGLAISGRPEPDASIDDVPISAGRWWNSAGEVVLGREAAEMFNLQVGQQLAVYATTSTPPTKAQASSRTPVMTLTVVGIAQSVSTPDVAAWMSPSDLAAIDPTTTPARQMLYRVEPFATAADLQAAAAAITEGLPSDVVASTYTYLETKVDVDATASLYVPILLAFSAFALAAAAFTIANIVSGIVLTSYRDIGVMKAIGFTPLQVTSILLAQVMVPATVGIVAGIVAGLLGSASTVERMARSFGLPGTFELSTQVVAVVALFALGVSFVAAVLPAVGAGRLSAVRAISSGTSPSGRPDGGRLRRLGLRLPARIATRLGVAAGLSHPIRATMTLGALLVGVAAVTFSLGVNASLVRAIAQIDRSAMSPVRAELMSASADSAPTTQAIAAHPDTERVVALGGGEVTVPGLGSVTFVGYDGDASWLGFELIRGRWFEGRGEVVAPTNFFRQSGLDVGDTIDLGGAGTVLLVGEIFDIPEEAPDGVLLRGAWADVQAADPGARLDRWEIQPQAGVASDDFRDAVSTTLGADIALYTIDGPQEDAEFLLFLSVVTFMGVVLVAISLGGVFNTVLLETRQRTREMAVLKALGMSPAQVVAMVLASVVPVGLVAGLLGVPLGLALQRAVIAYMAEVAGSTAVPESTFAVFAPAAFIGLSLAGLGIALAGAYLPAQRAARAAIAPVLQAE